MSAARADNGEIAEEPGSKKWQRCFCCNGVIASVSDQDISVGLNPALGLVSDECALVCYSCTAKLMEEAAALRPKEVKRGRK